MRSALLSRVSAVGQPLGALYSNALIASDVDATKLHQSPLSGDTTVVPAFRFKCYSQRAARIERHAPHAVRGSPFFRFAWRTADIIFAAASVRDPLFRPPQGSTIPHICTALSTTLPPPSLNFSLTPGTQGQFLGSAL